MGLALLHKNKKYMGNASSSQEIIEFYLKPSTAKETVAVFGISLYLLDKILQEHNINKHSTEIKNRLTREATKKALIKKYGVSSPFKLNFVKEKIKQTIQEKYNVDNPAKNIQIKEKTRQTCQEKYGGNGPMFSKEVRAKSEKTCLERYGVSIATKSEMIKNKIKKTDLEKYGTEYHITAKSVKNKIKKTNIEKFGQEFQIGSEQTKNKIKETNLERYGVECSLNYPEFKAKAETSLIKKFGTSSFFGSSNCKKRRVQFQQKAIKKYGSPNNVIQITKTKELNNTFCSSRAEDAYYIKLCAVFSEENISRQYIDERYPFHCDFYIRSIDTFIELNFLWTHGGKLFENSELDKEKLAIWQEKAKTSKFYQNAIEVWTISDVNKYSIAKLHNLNYLVFYTESDAIAWLDKK